MELNTIIEHQQNQIIIEKSRFICDLFPVTSEVEAKEFINKIKEEHPKASHHCYAYVIRKEFQNIENQSDDGEPSKTAGLPMLEILRYEKLVNVVAVVTRYFGGTLLGTGGLIRAYSASVKQAVDLSKIRTVVLMQGYRLQAPYSFSDMVVYELKKDKAIIKKLEYLEQVNIDFYSENDNLIELIKNKANNQIKIEFLDKTYL